jgi:hypothetical protein
MPDSADGGRQPGRPSGARAPSANGSNGGDRCARTVSKRFKRRRAPSPNGSNGEARQPGSAPFGAGSARSRTESDSETRCLPRAARPRTIHLNSGPVRSRRAAASQAGQSRPPAPIPYSSSSPEQDVAQQPTGRAEDGTPGPATHRPASAAARTVTRRLERYRAPTRLDPGPFGKPHLQDSKRFSDEALARTPAPTYYTHEHKYLGGSGLGRLARLLRVGTFPGRCARRSPQTTSSWASPLRPRRMRMSGRAARVPPPGRRTWLRCSGGSARWSSSTSS